jgi:hypothetical protein
MNSLQHRIRTRGGCSLALAAWLMSVGCGDDEGTPPRHKRDASDAAAEGGDASVHTAVTEAEVESILTDLFSKFDSAVGQNCSCYVEMGAYSSVDECLMWQSSRPDWASCTASVVVAHPMWEGLEMFQCIVGALEENSQCLSTKPCDAEARAECGLDPLRCIGTDNARSFGLELSTACPDITLLPRQH